MSHANNLLITSGMDNTVKVWSPNHKEPVINMSHYMHNFKVDNVTNVVDRVSVLESCRSTVNPLISARGFKGRRLLEGGAKKRGAFIAKHFY